MFFFCREWGLSASGGLPKGYPTGRSGEGLAALQTVRLMHFEAYILENKENIQDHLTFLQVRQQTDGHLDLFLLSECISFPSRLNDFEIKSENYIYVYFVIMIYNMTNKSRII